MNLTEIANSKCFDGYLRKYQHSSKHTKCDMKVSVFHPPTDSKLVLVFLSGLTCNEDNFMHKAGALKYCSELGITMICPDTSPRGLGLAGEDESWDFGSGAGFYVDATEGPWAENYHMYSYIREEIPELISELGLSHLAKSIMGHSMGGHGALVLALREPHQYRRVSAFAPIVNPSDVPWGLKAFSGYLGENRNHWQQYDASQLLLETSYKGRILIDQGSNDQFLDEQLQPDSFSKNCPSDIDLELRWQEGYDHSYYFISTFIKDHLDFHLQD